MRTGITMVRKHDSKKFEVVTGPDVAIHEQIRDAKQVGQTGDRTHPDYAEIQVWTSDAGLVKKLTFRKPAAPEVVLSETSGESSLQPSPNPEVELPSSQESVAPESEQPSDKTAKPNARPARTRR